MTTILEEMRDLKRWEDQTKALAAYLLHNGEINKDWAYNEGIEGIGRIKNLGARIKDLRDEGWFINTEKRQGVCWYVLVSAPKAETLQLAI